MSTDDPGPPPETYQSIMAATYRAFCEHGVADLTMRDIAAEFEKSRSLLHYHYDTKRELIVTLLDFLVDHYVETIEGNRTDDPRADLERVVNEALVGPEEPELEGFEFWEFHTALLELRAQAHRVPAYREQFEKSYEEIHATVAGIIGDGIDRGQFRAVDPDRYATLLLDATDAARSRAITLDQRDSAADSYDAIHERLLEPLYRETATANG